jgi:glycosyltransferase involved in cell wall biosynthesis
MRAVVVTGTILPEHHAIWRAAVARGVEVTLVGGNLNPYTGLWPWQDGDVPGVECVRLPVRQLRRGRGPIWWWYDGLGTVVDDRRPQIVHVLTEAWSTLVLQSLRIRRASPSLKVVAHGCDNQFLHGPRWERALRTAAIRYTLGRLDGYLSWNREGAELAERHGLRRGVAAAVVPAVVPEPSLFANGGSTADARSRFALPADRVVVGYIGRLTPEKGVLDLIDAVGRLDGMTTSCAVWGTGPLRDELGRLLGDRPQLGTLQPPLPLADVPAALRACDILAVPSTTTPEWKEQFGRIAVEAMHAGVPVVGYATGALPEVVGNAGLLVQEGDVDGLSRAVELLAGDPARRTELVARGRARAAALYDPAVAAAAIVRYWEGVLDKPAGNGRAA